MDIDNERYRFILVIILHINIAPKVNQAKGEANTS